MTEVLELRRKAGLTQAELASRSGVAQPNVAAYESGRRRPSPEMLDRLRAAARPRPSEALAAHRGQVVEVLARFGLSNPKVFGSLARRADAPGSDIDLLVDLADGVDVLDVIDAADALEELLGCSVDLVSSRGLAANHEIARTAVAL